MRCLDCARDLPLSSGPGRPRKFCADCRPSSARRRPLADRFAKECPECGGEFEGLATKKFCSASCQIKARDKAKRVPCAACGEPIHLGRGSRPAGEARCIDCSRSGCGTWGAYRRGCRCIDCRRANAEATARYLPPAYKHHWISPADRFALYERDRWTCQICMKPVDLTVGPLHRLAPSLDHIEPQSLALIPNHHPSNLRTAHRGCNSARGNRIAA